MTNEEIESYRQQLIETRKIKDNEERNIALIAIRDAVGASGCGGDKPWPERDAQNIASIQEALKTAAMINKAKRPVFPTLSRLPSSITESQFSPFEAEDYPENWHVECLACGSLSFIHERQRRRQQTEAVEVLDGLPSELVAAMGYERKETTDKPVIFSLASPELLEL